jgi:hypothetical protein
LRTHKDFQKLWIDWHKTAILAQDVEGRLGAQAMSKEEISMEEFRKRLAQLCLTSVGLSARQRDRHILLTGLSLYFETSRSYTESEINQLTERWLSGEDDHRSFITQTLRCTLSGERYLNWRPDVRSCAFDIQICSAPKVDTVDLWLVIQ